MSDTPWFGPSRNDDQLVAEQGVNPADAVVGVVGQFGVESSDEFGGAQVPDAINCYDLGTGSDAATAQATTAMKSSGCRLGHPADGARLIASTHPGDVDRICGKCPGRRRCPIQRSPLVSSFFPSTRR